MSIYINRVTGKLYKVAGGAGRHSPAATGGYARRQGDCN